MKDFVAEPEAPQFHVYIPIWIDLKGAERAYMARNGADLHSNMDRFERRP